MTVMTAPLQQILDRTLSILPVSNEDIVVRGITAELTGRIVELKRAARTFRGKHSSLEQLERTLAEEGISPDDHTRYADLLEWRAIRSELAELIDLLESI
ncbi:MAG: hypothetical protein H8D78_12870 [Chloroflexi bacterium]|nr:hypothetical protein [Chloroflexota bacterium]